MANKTSHGTGRNGRTVRRVGLAGTKSDKRYVVNIPKTTYDAVCTYADSFDPPLSIALAAAQVIAAGLNKPQAYAITATVKPRVIRYAPDDDKRVTNAGVIRNDGTTAHQLFTTVDSNTRARLLAVANRTTPRRPFAYVLRTLLILALNAVEKNSEWKP